MKQYKLCVYLLIALCFLFTSLNAQVDTAWIRRYNGPGNGYDNALFLALDGQGNVYVTGKSMDSGTSYDCATIKYNSAGVEQWIARYNGPANGSDEGYSLAVDGQGNVYVTGHSYGSGTDDDYLTIKYNSAGVEQWVARYDGPGSDNDYAYSLAVDGQGNVYVTGYVTNTTVYPYNYDYTTIKYNSLGDTVWIRRYDGPGNWDDVAYSLAVDGQGNVYVTGGSSGSGTSYDCATIKYNSAGVEQWVARYNGPGNGVDKAYSLAVDGQSNVYITGYSYGSGTGSSDYVTIKYNSAGAEQWVARYNGPGNGYDDAYFLALDGQQYVYVTGYSVGSGTYYDYATIKYNSAGVEQWVARYNGLGNNFDAARSIAVDIHGNVYVTGYSKGSGTDFDYATIKYSSAGVEQWVQRYNGPGNYYDDAYAIAVDNQGNVYLTGQSFGSSTFYDYATIKYVQSQLVEENHSSLSADCFSLKLYPNPAKSLTAIRYSLPSESKVSLLLYDISGRLVTTLVNEQKKQGNYSINLNTKTLSAGIYFLSLETESKRVIERLVVVK